MCKSLRIKHGLLKFGIVGKAHRSEISLANLSLVGTKRITGSHQGDTCVEAFRKHFVNAVGTAGGRSLAGIRQISDSLVEVGEYLLEYHFAARFGQVDGFGLYGFETGGNVSPCLAKVIIKHGAERQRFTEKIGHVILLFHVSIFTQALNSKIGTLDGSIHYSEYPLGLVELAIVGKAIINANLRLIVVIAEIICVIPLNVGIETIPGKQPVTVRFVDAECMGYPENGVLGKSIVGIHRRSFVG